MSQQYYPESYSQQSYSQQSYSQPDSSAGSPVSAKSSEKPMNWRRILSWSLIGLTFVLAIAALVVASGKSSNDSPKPSPLPKWSNVSFTLESTPSFSVATGAIYQEKEDQLRISADFKYIGTDEAQAPVLAGTLSSLPEVDQDIQCSGTVLMYNDETNNPHTDKYAAFAIIYQAKGTTTATLTIHRATTSSNFFNSATKHSYIQFNNVFQLIPGVPKN
jgi:hypothetical protein